MSTKEDLQKAVVFGNSQIIAKGGTSEATTIREVLNNIDTISSGGTDYDTLNISEYIKEKFLESFEANKADGYVAGAIYAFEAIEENMLFERKSQGFFTGKMKYIYSDMYETIEPHLHTFDTSKDITTKTGNYRYRIVLIKEPWGLFPEPPVPVGYVQAVNIRYVFSFGNGTSSLTYVEYLGLRELTVMNMTTKPELGRYNFQFRGREPEVIDGIDFLNMNFFGGSATKLRNLSNILGDVNLSLYNYGIDKESILCILNALLPVPSGTTYNVRIHLYRLTDDDIAIATAKGYIVSNPR